MRQTLRAVLPGASSLLAAISSSSSSSHNTQASFHPCSTSTSREETGPSTPFPAPPTVRCDDDDRTELLAGLHFSTTTTGGNGSTGGFQLIHNPTTPTAAADVEAAINPARWVTVGRSKGQPGADVTRGVLRLWLRNDHPTEAFHAEAGRHCLLDTDRTETARHSTFILNAHATTNAQVMETLPFFLAPQLRALAATALPLPFYAHHHPNQSSASPLTPLPLPFVGVNEQQGRPRFRKGQGKDPAVLEYGIELSPASLVHVALPFRTRCVAMMLIWGGSMSGGDGRLSSRHADHTTQSNPTQTLPGSCTSRTSRPTPAGASTSPRPSSACAPYPRKRRRRRG